MRVSLLGKWPNGHNRYVVQTQMNTSGKSKLQIPPDFTACKNVSYAPVIPSANLWEMSTKSVHVWDKILIPVLVLKSYSLRYVKFMDTNDFE